METVYEFKCRRCGAIQNAAIPDVGVSEKSKAVSKLFAAIGGNKESLTMISVHCCSDGGRGITDLIGCSFKL
jgi:hypothetical protein